jgi:hypothetical protein
MGMLFILIAALAVVCQVFGVIVEARETHAAPKKTLGGLLLACGLFVMCVCVFA